MISIMRRILMNLTVLGLSFLLPWCTPLFLNRHDNLPVTSILFSPNSCEPVVIRLFDDDLINQIDISIYGYNKEGKEVELQRMKKLVDRYLFNIYLDNFPEGNYAVKIRMVDGNGSFYSADKAGFTILPCNETDYEEHEPEPSFRI